MSSASIALRSAIRLFVVAFSESQKSRRTISPLFGWASSISPPAPPGFDPSRPFPRHDSSAYTARRQFFVAAMLSNHLHRVDLIDVDDDAISGGRMHSLDALTPLDQVQPSRNDDVFGASPIDRDPASVDDRALEPVVLLRRQLCHAVVSTSSRAETCAPSLSITNGKSCASGEI